jgi:hypothetical protein
MEASDDLAEGRMYVIDLDKCQTRWRKIARHDNRRCMAARQPLCFLGRINQTDFAGHCCF